MPIRLLVAENGAVLGLLLPLHVIKQYKYYVTIHIFQLFISETPSGNA